MKIIKKHLKTDLGKKLFQTPWGYGYYWEKIGKDRKYREIKSGEEIPDEKANEIGIKL